MARIASVAVGGYYPTPAHLLGRIAALLALEPETSGRRDAVVGGYSDQWGLTALDPCAGDGAAARGILAALVGERAHVTARLYAVELERQRFEALNRKPYELPIDATLRTLEVCALHSDAFAVSARVHPGARGPAVLYLNPPYDTDRTYGRLEEKFLRRFAPVLNAGAALLFVVPFHALAASADTLATNFDSLACYRFPGEDFDVFKQVVVVGRRIPALDAPDAAVSARVREWAADASSQPELPAAGVPVASPLVLSLGDRYEAQLSDWQAHAFDVDTYLEGFTPWAFTDRGGASRPVTGVGVAHDELGARTFPVAMPPRPAHIAAGIAAGVFDGARIEPDDAASGLPALLVKGTFDREFRTIEEKQNKDGETTALVRVQQPRLRVTVLDLTTSRFHAMLPDAEPSGSTSLDAFTLGDLLALYGRGLLATLLAHCPVVHDPANAGHVIPLPTLARPLFNAQAHATMAAVKLLGGLRASRAERRGKCCFVLGEIGSGKSSVAIAVSMALRCGRTLVLCPPHLLDGWRDQVGFVAARGVRVVVLESVADVDALAADVSEQPVVAILSRETAKLGHAYAGVSGACPACGAGIPEGDLGQRRARCEHAPRAPRNDAARWCAETALAMAPGYIDDPRTAQLVSARGRMAARMAAHVAKRGRGDRRANTARLVARLAPLLALATPEHHLWDAQRAYGYALGMACAATGDAETVAELADECYRRGAALGGSEYGEGDMLQALALNLALLLPMGSARQDALRAGWAADGKWSVLVDAAREKHGAGSWFTVKLVDGRATVKSIAWGDPAGWMAALAAVSEHASYAKGKVCGEALYQAVPAPRRFPLANYIARRHPALFDLLVLDESHEYSTDGSAQERAAHRLTALGLPTLALTGSVMNGYAESLFANLWAMSPKFRAEFARHERKAFVERYGYRKILVEDRDADTKKPVLFGAQSDRVERNERDLGNAPGVLPLAILKHLLPLAVTLQKADLALDLPACREIPTEITATPELLARHKAFASKLLAQVRKDMFTRHAGKLFGAVSELPAHLDRATRDAGNAPDGAYEACYPAADGGGMVARAEPFAAAEVLPKEAWILETVARELAEGRRVMVFSWHKELLPRLARLISAAIGEPVPVLASEKVAAGKRQGWIDREVIAKGRRVLVVNPVCVQTGLNNLVHFATEIWTENPACNPIAYRQAVGRVDRIGQTLETRIYFPVYGGTAQIPAHRLLMHKVGVSLATDGLDAESALAAAGATEGATFAGLSVGKQLYELLTDPAAAVALERAPAWTRAAAPASPAAVVVHAGQPVLTIAPPAPPAAPVVPTDAPQKARKSRKPALRLIQGDVVTPPPAPAAPVAWEVPSEGEWVWEGVFDRMDV